MDNMKLGFILSSAVSMGAAIFGYTMKSFNLKFHIYILLIHL